MRKIWLILAVILPCPLKLWLYRNLLGWKIGSRVKIGFSYIDADKVVLDDEVRIGHFNIIRQLRLFQVGKHAYIRNFNEFFGNQYDSPEWTRQLVIGEGVLCMSHHFIDVAGEVMIGSHSVIAGRDTHFWSHSLTYKIDRTLLQPMNIYLGERVYVGARATILGSSIPDRAIIGAGSVVNKKIASEDCPLLIAGNPATIKKRYVFDIEKHSSSI